VTTGAGPPQEPGALPNLVIIGAQKCGTSALHYYLDLHPEVQMSSPKELSFFLDQSELEPGPYVSDPRDMALVRGDRNWGCGVDWYRSHFSAEAPVRGEATPGYASPWFPKVAEHMAQVVPDAKLIYIVRDPIERLVSHFLHMRAMGREHRTLEEAVGTGESVYTGRSRYSTMLEPFRQRYGDERILLLRQDMLLGERRRTMRTVFGFVGVDPGFWSERMERERNVSGPKGRRYAAMDRLARTRVARPLYRLPQEVKWVAERLAHRRERRPKPSLPPEVEERIRRMLDPEMEGIEGLTGWDLTAWRAATRAPL
jgi:hypothetical protein